MGQMSGWNKETEVKFRKDEIKKQKKTKKPQNKQIKPNKDTANIIGWLSGR